MSDSDSDPSATLSLPSLVLFVVLLAFGARYLFSSRSSPSTTAPRDRVDAQKVDQVAQMFPQLDRRAIAWDLSRNGGSVGATTEKVLSRGFLDTVRLTKAFLPGDILHEIVQRLSTLETYR